MEKIINGKQLSSKIKEDLKKEIETFDFKPTLAVIQVGNDPASEVYVGAKKKASLEVGINFKHLKYEDTISENEIIKKINELNLDSEVNGILVQLPLPKHIDSKSVINAINSNKDVDGLTDINVGKLVNNKDCLISCTPLGVFELLKEYKVEIESKHVVIIGKSNLVGKPLISLFLNEGATVTVCHSKTSNLSNFTNQADILVVATGYKHLIDASMVKKDAVVIDVGITRIDNKLYGDVNFDSVYDKISLITPVPGGVGPMTVTMLLKNVINSYKKSITSKY
jgi:methylenetetrahydrofolate dehydrogenase (NADP+)/methenyltetrahydrofolate cyclohydrolase